jgi:cysteine desulfurase
VTVPRGLTEGPIYLDYNATTPVDPAVTEAMQPYLSTMFGNPSSDHYYGHGPRVALEQARDQVTALIGLPAAESCSPGPAPRPTTSPSAARSSPPDATVHT